MVCELAETAAEALWPALLELRRFVQTEAALEQGQVAFLREGGVWRLAVDATELGRVRTGGEDALLVPLEESGDELLDAATNVFSNLDFRSGASPIRPGARPLDEESRCIFRLYLPMLLGGFRARRRGECFITAHVAQTLDGRIACLNGHSQWISNQANLIHAHRIRALHDGVMVGRGTVEKDDPALTVRHIGGEHPRRVVLNASGSLLGAEPSRFKIFDDEGCLLVTSHSSTAAPSGELPDTVEVVRLDAVDGGPSPATLAKTFAERGLHSIFLEGGSATLSRYFELRAIDLLHIHCAPMILGSGISSFSLPEVETVQRARRMTTAHFMLDGELMIECRDQRGGA